jgi:transcriptional antiterminator RfaH
MPVDRAPPSTGLSGPKPDLPNAPLASTAVPWFVCHTKPRCEKKFAQLLALEHFAHSLPLVQSIRRYPGQVKRFTKPLFPGYVFAQIEVERKARIYQQELIVRAIPVDDVSTFLRQLEDVKAIVASGLEASLHPLLKKGAHVRIVNGALKGVEGMIEDPHHPKGVVISMDVLQQGVLVRIPLEDLKLLAW